MFAGLRTIISAVIAMLPSIANILGFEVAPGFTEEANQLVGDIITVGGTAAAIYFRAVATVPGWLTKQQ